MLATAAAASCQKPHPSPGRMRDNPSRSAVARLPSLDVDACRGKLVPCLRPAGWLLLSELLVKVKAPSSQPKVLSFGIGCRRLCVPCVGFSLVVPVRFVLTNLAPEQASNTFRTTQKRFSPNSSISFSLSRLPTPPPALLHLVAYLQPLHDTASTLAFPPFSFPSC